MLLLGLRRLAATTLIIAVAAACGGVDKDEGYVTYPAFGLDEEGKVVLFDEDPRIGLVEDNFDAHLDSIGLRRDELDAKKSLVALSTWLNQERLTEIIPIEDGDDSLIFNWGNYDQTSTTFAYSLERFFVASDRIDDDSFYGLEIRLTYDVTQSPPPLPGVIICELDQLSECVSDIEQHPATKYIGTSTLIRIEIQAGNRG